MGIKKFDMVLFMNDIVWCTSDMLEVGGSQLLMFFVYPNYIFFHNFAAIETAHRTRIAYDMCHRLGLECRIRPMGGKNHVWPVSHKPTVPSYTISLI